MKYSPDIPKLIQKFKDLLDNFIGTDAIYKESDSICLIRLSDIDVTDWGISANVKPIRDLVEYRDEKPWHISASWEAFRFTDIKWSGFWNIYFDKQFVDAIIKTSDDYSDKEPGIRYMEMYALMMAHEIEILRSIKQAHQHEDES